MYKYIALSNLEQMKQQELIRRIDQSMDVYNLGYESDKKKKDELTPAMMSRISGVKYEAIRKKQNG